MKYFAKQSVFLTALMVLATSVQADVKNITGGKEAFEKELKNSSKPTMVKFFAPWCGFCKRIKDTYEGYVKQYPECNFVEVDVIQEPALGEAYSPQGFPTFIVFDKNSTTKLDEIIGADVERLEACIKKHAGKKDDAPAATPAAPAEDNSVAVKPSNAVIGGVNTIKTQEQLDAFLQSGTPVVLKVHADWCGACKMMKEPFEELATKTPEVTFLSLDYESGDVAKNLGVQGLPTFFFYEANAKKAANKVSGARKEEVKNWVKKLQDQAKAQPAPVKPAAKADAPKPAAQPAAVKADVKAAPAPVAAPAAVVAPAKSAAPASAKKN